ncbi:MAG: hypothetical protein MZV64_46580 [Ignavibacteriales bacterium]|nr:hypothetical protein [Ignavibacteriales bacterium]
MLRLHQQLQHWLLGDALSSMHFLKKEILRKRILLFFIREEVWENDYRLKIKEIMITGERIPIVNEDTSIKDVIIEITSKRLGTTCVVDEQWKTCWELLQMVI